MCQTGDLIGRTDEFRVRAGDLHLPGALEITGEDKQETGEPGDDQRLLLPPAIAVQALP